MDEIDQKRDWIFQLWRTASDSADKDEKEVARILMRALEIEFKRIKRIRELARLLLDYQLASPSLFSRWRFFYVKN